MGIIADILEDSEERWGQWVDSGILSTFPPGPLPPTPQQHRCPLCPETFKSIEDVHAHIFEMHRHQHAYLIVNDRIVYRQRVVPLSEPIKRLAVRFSGSVPPVVSLTTKMTPDASEVTEEIQDLRQDDQLVKYLPTASPYLVRIEIAGYGLVELYCLSRKVFDFSGLDSYIEELENELLRNVADVSWGQWERRLRNVSSDYAVCLYVGAHYDYLLGYWLETVEREGIKAVRHYERAAGNLMAFNTPKANAVRRAAAFKLNWFDEALPANPQSPFYWPARFFTENFNTISSNRARFDVDAQSHQGPSVRVLINEFDHSVMNAVRFFLSSDDASLMTVLHSLQHDPAYKLGRYHSDKVALLWARYLRVRGEWDRAREWYEDLKAHHYFAREAAECGVF